MEEGRRGGNGRVRGGTVGGDGVMCWTMLTVGSRAAEERLRLVLRCISYVFLVSLFFRPEAVDGARGSGRHARWGLILTSRS